VAASDNDGGTADFTVVTTAAEAAAATLEADANTTIDEVVENADTVQVTETVTEVVSPEPGPDPELPLPEDPEAPKIAPVGTAVNVAAKSEDDTEVMMEPTLVDDAEADEEHTSAAATTSQTEPLDLTQIETIEAVQTEFVQTDITQTETADIPQTEAAQTDVRQTESMQTDIAQIKITNIPQMKAAQTDLLQTEFVQTEAALTDPVQTEFVQTEAAQVEAVQVQAREPAALHLEAAGYAPNPEGVGPDHEPSPKLGAPAHSLLSGTFRGETIPSNGDSGASDGALDVFGGELGASNGNFSPPDGGLDVSSGELGASNGNLGASKGDIDAPGDESSASNGALDVSVGESGASGTDFATTASEFARRVVATLRRTHGHARVACNSRYKLLLVDWHGGAHGHGDWYGTCRKSALAVSRFIAESPTFELAWPLLVGL